MKKENEPDYEFYDEENDSVDEKDLLMEKEKKIINRKERNTAIYKINTSFINCAKKLKTDNIEGIEKIKLLRVTAGEIATQYYLYKKNDSNLFSILKPYNKLPEDYAYDVYEYLTDKLTKNNFAFLEKEALTYDENSANVDKEHPGFSFFNHYIEKEINSHILTCLTKEEYNIKEDSHAIVLNNILKHIGCKSSSSISFSEWMIQGEELAKRNPRLYTQTAIKESYYSFVKGKEVLMEDDEDEDGLSAYEKISNLSYAEDDYFKPKKSLMNEDVFCSFLDRLNSIYVRYFEDKHREIFPSGFTSDTIKIWVDEAMQLCDDKDCRSSISFLEKHFDDVNIGEKRQLYCKEKYHCMSKPIFDIFEEEKKIVTYLKVSEILGISVSKISKVMDEASEIIKDNVKIA